MSAEKTLMIQEIDKYFSKCPLCLAKGSMVIDWGYRVPKTISCKQCNGRWSLLFKTTPPKLLSAMLIRQNVDGEGRELLNESKSPRFWKDRAFRTVKKERATKTASKLVKEIIREKEVIVKIRCQYCNNLFDETLDKCPHCGGKR